MTPSAIAARFPRIPGLPSPDSMYLPILDYDFGAAFDPNDMRGAIVTPPTVRRVVTPLVPQVDRDGNELAGIKSPLVANPLGTYLGWNVTASGFERGRQCAFSGGFVPFTLTRAEREATGDPRPSIAERYAGREAYVQAVRASAQRLVRERFLLQEDADRIVADAAHSAAFAPRSSSTEANRR